MNVFCSEQSRFLRICAVVRWSHSGQRPRESAWGATPLHKAASKGDVEAAELLLSKGAAVDATDNYGPGLSGRARNPVSNLGHLNKFFRLEIHEKNVCSTCGTVLQMEQNSPDGPLSRMLQRIDSKLFWMSSLARWMDPLALEVVDVCVINFWPCLVMSPWMTRVPKAKWNGLSLQTCWVLVASMNRIQMKRTFIHSKPIAPKSCDHVLFVQTEWK